MPAQKGNKYAQKYTIDEAMEVFIQMLEFSKTDECLCIQDAFLHVELPSSTFYDLVSKYKVLENIKRDIMANIISRVNRSGLRGEFNPTASIWRMKQLGEKDKTEVQNTNVDVPLTKDEIESYKKKNKDLLEDY